MSLLQHESARNVPQIMSRTECIERRWIEFVAARDKAMASRNVADGIACGRSWSAFLEVFTDEHTR